MDIITFGTDGVRGQSNRSPMNPETVFRIGLAAGQVLGENGTALIARDTRLSGPMLEAALASALAATGVDVLFGDVLPTAALSLAVQARNADLGIMVSASHNKATDNGVKFFARGGGKISDDQQSRIEALINTPELIKRAEPSRIGKVYREPDIADSYLKTVRSLFSDQSLSGLKLVVDCANGSNSKWAPELLTEAGAEVIAMHNDPDGDNINLDCGSTYPQSLQAKVLEEQADVGIAFDGDADRLVLVDETANLIDGDQILARLAGDWQMEGKLKGGQVVATVMSNMGLEQYLDTLGLSLERTPVGDRHVSARLNELGCNLGGEQSGHILMPDLLPSGDGLICGLMLLLSLNRASGPASQHLQCFKAMPQILHNVRHTADDPLEQPSVQTVIGQVSDDLGTNGRILVRASGTEPLIRIMAEAETVTQAQDAVDQIVRALTQTR